VTARKRKEGRPRASVYLVVGSDGSAPERAVAYGGPDARERARDGRRLLDATRPADAPHRVTRFEWAEEDQGE